MVKRKGGEHLLKRCLLESSHRLKDFLLSGKRKLCAFHEGLCVCSDKELFISQLMSFSILHLRERCTHDGSSWYKEAQDPPNQPAHFLFKSEFVLPLTVENIMDWKARLNSDKGLSATLRNMK